MQVYRRATFLSCLVVLLSGAPAVAAPAVTEYPVTQNDTNPLGISTSPDGTLLFAEGSTSAFGVSLVNGTTFELGGLSGPAAGVTQADGDVWMTEPGADRIARVVPGFMPHVTEYQLPNGAMPEGITADAAGDVWFTEQGGHGAIGEITPAGTIYQYSAGLTPNSDPTGITAVPGGNVWFTESANHGRIGEITPSGAITEYLNGLTPQSDPTGIAAAPNGNVWFTESANPGRIGEITPSGTITEYTTGLAPNSDPTDIAPGPGGDLWFTEGANPGAIGWITPQGAISQVPTPTLNSQPNGITQGPNGEEWFTEDGNHGQIGQVVVPAPSAVTDSAIAVGATSAILTGTANPNGFSTTYQFQWGPTSAYGQAAPATAAVVGSGSSPQAVTQTVTGLTPDTVYHYRLLASNCGGCQSGTGDGADMTFTTAGTSSSTGPGAVTPTGPASPPAAPSLPVIGRTAVAAVAAGSVLVRVPGSAELQPLSADQSIPIGSLIDARKGRVDLTTEISKAGRLQSATAWGGEFVLGQSVTRGTTTFRLTGKPAACPASGSGHDSAARAMAVADRAASKSPPSLWAHDHDGRYSTRGNNSVATVRGTWWKTTETCRGTVTFVKQGVVSVLDLHTHHAVLVHAGHSFLARP